MIYAAYSSELEGVGGKYLEDSAITKSSGFSYDIEHQERLWQHTGATLSPWLDQLDTNVFDS